MAETYKDGYREFVVYEYTGDAAREWFGEGYRRLYHGALYVHWYFNLNEPVDMYTGLHTTLASLKKEIDAFYSNYPVVADVVTIGLCVKELSKKHPEIEKYLPEMYPKALDKALQEARYRHDFARSIDAPFCDYPEVSE